MQIHRIYRPQRRPPPPSTRIERDSGILPREKGFPATESGVPICTRMVSPPPSRHRKHRSPRRRQNATRNTDRPAAMRREGGKGCTGELVPLNSASRVAFERSLVSDTTCHTLGVNQLELGHTQEENWGIVIDILGFEDPCLYVCLQ
jgi:hypothetical protein